MQSFKLKNSRKSWWRCLRAVRSVISSRESRYNKLKEVPEGPWTPRRAETREAQQRGAFPVSPGLRARAPAPVSGRAAAAAQVMKSEPQPSLLPPHQRASVTLQARLQFGPVLPLTLCQTPPRQSGWYPSPVTPELSLRTVLPLLERPSQHPAVKVLLPGAAHRPSFPCGEQGHFFHDSLSKVGPSQLFSFYSEASFWSWYLCVLFLIIYKLIGSSSNWIAGRSQQAVFWAFWRL